MYWRGLDKFNGINLILEGVNLSPRMFSGTWFTIKLLMKETAPILSSEFHISILIVAVFTFLNGLIAI